MANITCRSTVKPMADAWEASQPPVSRPERRGSTRTTRSGHEAWDAHLRCRSRYKPCMEARTNDEPQYKSGERKRMEARAGGKPRRNRERGGNAPRQEFDWCCTVDIGGNDVDMIADDPYVAPGMNARLTTLGGRNIERQRECTAILIVLARETCVLTMRRTLVWRRWNIAMRWQIDGACAVGAPRNREIAGDTQTLVKSQRIRQTEPTLHLIRSEDTCLLCV